MLIKISAVTVYFIMMPFLAIYFFFSLSALSLLPISAPASSYIGGYIILIALGLSPFINIPYFNLDSLSYASKIFCTFNCRTRLTSMLLIIFLVLSTFAVIKFYSPFGSLNLQELGGLAYSAYQQNSDILANRPISIKIFANISFAVMVTTQILLVVKYSLLSNRLPAIISVLPSTLFSLSIGTFYGVFISLLSLETLFYISGRIVLRGIHPASSFNKQYRPQYNIRFSVLILRVAFLIFFLAGFTFLFISNQLSRYDSDIAEIGVCLNTLANICINPRSYLVQLLGPVQAFTLLGYTLIPLLQSGQVISSFFIDMPSFISQLFPLFMELENAKLTYELISPNNFVANWEPLLFRLSLSLTPLIALWILMILVKTLYRFSSKLFALSCSHFVNPYVIRFLLVFLCASFLVNDFFLYSVNLSFFCLCTLLMFCFHFRLAPNQAPG